MNEDESNRSAKEILATLAHLHRMLRDRAIELRRRPGVKEVFTQLEPTFYLSGPVIDSYLEVSFGEGVWLCWFLEMLWTEESWEISTRFEKKFREDSESFDLPTRTIHLFSELSEALKMAMRELLEFSPPRAWPASTQ